MGFVYASDSLSVDTTDDEKLMIHIVESVPELTVE
jgi:hypothetical protein